MMKYIPEPFRIKSVEPLKILTRKEREERLKKADYNVFALKSEDVYIDLLTDSGTNAMSSAQWAGVMMGDESYAGASSYLHLIENAKEIFGFEYIQPVHQGRAAEKVLLPILLKGKKYSISNMHFDTTRAHVALTGAIPVDCVVPEALDTTLRADFKGNMDVERLEKLIKEYGPENVGVIVQTITNNSAGGQPVSVANIRATAAVAKKYNIPFMIDAARYAENSYFVKQREPEFKNSSIQEIVRESFKYADVFTMSAKKDAIVNMGGLVGARDKKLFEKIKQNCISFEGFVTYGGMSGRDLEALAIGLKEGIDENYLRYRIGQMEYLAARLDDAGIAYQSPVGGHGVFVDAKKLLPHMVRVSRTGAGVGALSRSGHTRLRHRLLHARPRSRHGKGAGGGVRVHPSCHTEKGLHAGASGRNRRRADKHKGARKQSQGLQDCRGSAYTQTLHGKACSA